MLQDVVTAFDRQDYKTAARLVKQLLQQSPENPWAQLYLARLQEVAGKFDQAEKIYRQLLKDVSNPKLVTQARQGMQRLEVAKQEQRKAAIAQATADPKNTQPGFLVLASVPEVIKATAIQNLARIMKVDVYTARMLLPKQGWKLYRAGIVGELQVYGEMLRSADIPAFWAAQPEIEKLPVFQVKYFQATVPQAMIICENEQGQLGQLTFNWAEVTHCVEGILPIFEQVLELGYRDRLERKETTQDYTRVYDLHLLERQCILRIQESEYQFNQGVAVIPADADVAERDRNTIRTNWNYLIEQLHQAMPAAIVWTEFASFAETTADFATPLNRLKSQIKLMRLTECYWDAAFQLYSSLIFLQSFQ
jgi:tetratricopeptide (TPR) repeat protein